MRSRPERTRQRRTRQRGLSLVELMVAIAIGLILTTVIAQVFLSNKQAFSATDDLSRMQENMRYSLGLLERIIRLTYYRSNFTQDGTRLYPRPVIAGGTGTVPCPYTPPAADNFANPGQSICGTNGSSGASDDITVRFQGSGNGTGTPDGFVVECQGIRMDAGRIAVNRFYIANDPSNNNAPSLWCDNSGTEIGWIVGTPPTLGPVPITPDVENMQILYGEDTSADRAIDRYVEAGSVGNWDKVLTARIALLYRSASPSGGAGGPTSYTMNGVTITAGGDQRTRRVQTITIGLRNRLP